MSYYHEDIGQHYYLIFDFGIPFGVSINRIVQLICGAVCLT